MKTEVLCYILYRIQLKSYYTPYDKVYGFSGFTKVAAQFKLKRRVEPRPLYVAMVQDIGFVRFYQNSQIFLDRLGIAIEDVFTYIEPTFEKIAHYFRMIQDVNVFEESNGSTLYTILVVCLFYGMRELKVPLKQFSECSGISLAPLQYLVEQFTKCTTHPNPLDHSFAIKEWSDKRSYFGTIQLNTIKALRSGTNASEREREYLYALFPLAIYFIWTNERGNTNRIDVSAMLGYQSSKRVLVEIPPSTLYSSLDAYIPQFIEQTFDFLVKSGLSFDIIVRALLYVSTFRLHTQLLPEELNADILYQVAVSALILSEESINGLVSVETWATYSGYSVNDLEQVVMGWFKEVQHLDTLQDIEYYSTVLQMPFEELVHHFISIVEMENEQDLPVNPSEQLNNVFAHFVGNLFQQIFVENYPVTEKILFNLNGLYRKAKIPNPERPTYFYLWDYLSSKSHLGLLELYQYAKAYPDLMIVVAQRNIDCINDAQTWYSELGIDTLPNVIIMKRLPTIHQDFFFSFPSEYGFLVDKFLLIYKGLGFGHPFVHHVPRFDRITVLEHIDVLTMLQRYRTDFVIDLDKKNVKVEEKKPISHGPIVHKKCNPLDPRNPLVGTRFEPIKVLGNTSIYLNPKIIPHLVKKKHWIIHFWNHYIHRFKHHYHWLRTLAKHPDYAVITVQMDQGVDFHVLFEEVKGLDISEIAIINDFPGFFKRFYLTQMAEPTPACLIGFANKVSYVNKVLYSGPSFGNSSFSSLPDLDALQPCYLPDWKSPNIHRFFDYKHLITESTLYMSGSALLPQVNSRVVMIHVWNRHVEESVQAFEHFIQLKEHYPEYNHLAVHVDLNDELTTPEYFQKNQIVKFHDFVSLVDIKKEFQEFWRSCEFTALPCTLIIVDNNIQYVGPSHQDCSLPFFSASINALLTQLPEPIQFILYNGQ